MKLQEFFIIQKHTTLSDIDKLKLYQNILYKRTKKSLLKRSLSVRIKYIIYSMIFFVLILGIYGTYIFNTNNIKDYKFFSILSSSTKTNNVQADYIAQVINFNGNFSIEHQGILTKTKNISNGDTIFLKEGSQIVFEINNGTQSKIIGPAKLVIQKIHGENYKLNLIYGNFIKVKNTNKKQQTIEVAINDIVIKQQDISKPINFEFMKNQNNQILKNNGDALIVTKSNGKEKTTTMNKQQILTIQNNDIKIYANFDSFNKALREKNISQTFILTTTKEIENTNSGTTITEQTNNEIGLLSLLTNENKTFSQENIEEISENISSIITDTKQVLNPDQNEKIRGGLYKEFIIPEIKQIYIGYQIGDQTIFNEGFNKLEKRINNIYTSFGINYTNQTGQPNEKMKGLTNDIQIFINKIKNEYLVPPKFENLQIIINRCNMITTKGYAIETGQENATIAWEQLQTKLPSGLIFQ